MAAYNRYGAWQRVNPGPATVTIGGDVSGALTVTPGQTSSASITLSPAPGQPMGDYGSAASSFNAAVDLYGRVTNGSDNVAQKTWGLINAVTLSYTGDATGGPTSFNGVSNVSTALTLATVNASPGTYALAKVAVNGKGLATTVVESASSDLVALQGVTAVASLPGSPTNGQRSFVTDSTVAASGNFGAVVAGTGTYSVPVFYDGANWRIG